LEIDPGSGVRVVRVEPGHQLDPAAAFNDPRDANDHPLAVHLERDVLPGFANVGDASHKWLQGIEDADPADMGALVASRFTYRRLFRRAAWLTLPVLALLALFFPVVVFSTRQRHALVHIFRLLAAGFAIELILVAVALAFVVAQARGGFRVAGPPLARRTRSPGTHVAGADRVARADARVLAPCGSGRASGNGHLAVGRRRDRVPSENPSDRGGRDRVRRGT